jgi:hypothetical protein
MPVDEAWVAYPWPTPLVPHSDQRPAELDTEMHRDVEAVGGGCRQTIGVYAICVTKFRD